MEIVDPEPPIGQQFILRRHLHDILSRAHFDGEAWHACVAAFLEAPGLPLLMHKGVTQASASFFLNLYGTREPSFPPEGEGRWGEAEVRRRLAELGVQPITLLIATDQSRSWAIYLSEALDEVFAFHGRTLPGPRYSFDDDLADLKMATLVRHLSIGPGLTVVRLDHSNLPTPALELTDDTGHRYVLTFIGFRKLVAASPGNVDIARVDEVRGPSGRTWFIFEPSRQAGERKLAVQAEAVSLTEST